jgi:hypothetical protein
VSLREHGCFSFLPPRERQRVIGGEVAGPGLEGGQVAVLRPNVAISWPRNEYTVLSVQGSSL